MSFLVQDFLDFAQIKSGKFRVNLKEFDILTTIDKVMSIQREKASEAKIDFLLQAENIQGTSYNIISDEQRVMQVLLNLQSNALKFTQAGSVTIHVAIEDEGEDKFLKISVADTGIGIPAEDQDKLFKLFGFV
mmetsp:Transcript_17654/g.27313  ORF Transcript_17654/g.27313 Transcript_17654/m.27313 type:complete len:133 (+) Transcript_17654:1525-1923(+)|eukprot:CAMPEP_0170492964 /NCGR_PEP_ID=MMETSP0208-20121228/13124_1 /TAXON_ID=197538 /ORGANISM="Strombidium inclinatum, Strain S3" /LENGTH=132 /DNA_ID=CAMNT_0010768807 /DNA_START=1525 /DNA_END=1923 /DNA_ORIENTATION=+